jgi:hypothetical protein
MAKDNHMNEFEVVNLPFEKINGIRPLLEQSPFKPLRYLGQDANAGLNNFWLDSIVDLAQNKNAQIFAALHNQGVIGILVYIDNPWETAILGKKAGVINYFIVSESSPYAERAAADLLDKVIQYAVLCGIQFLLCKPYTDTITIIHTLERQGFLLMDTLIDCHYDYRRFPLNEIIRPSIANDVAIRLAKGSDEQELVSVARSAFQKHFGRYNADERMRGEYATRFYEEWIKSSLNGYADWLCVAEIGGRIAGYSIWKKPSPMEVEHNFRVGHYSIAGIHPDYFGRGLFTALTYEGMKLLDGSADIIEGPTHINNYGVQLGYSKLHWRICSDARHSFHKWL